MLGVMSMPLYRLTLIRCRNRNGPRWFNSNQGHTEKKKKEFNTIEEIEKDWWFAIR